MEAKDEKSSKELERFVKFALGKKHRGEMSVLCEDVFIPYPEEFRIKDEKAEKGEISKDGFNSGGYEWCTENWGTKWGICNARIFSNRICRDWGKVVYYFECAWSPPIPVIEKMAELFPLLTFELKYFEGGMAFKGIMVCSEGKVKKHTTARYRGSRGG